MTKDRGTKDVLVRFPPDVYAAVKDAAALAGVSMNNLIVETTRAAYSPQSFTPGTSPSDLLNSSRSYYTATVASNSNSLAADTPFSASLQTAINALAGESTTTSEEPPNAV